MNVDLRSSRYRPDMTCARFNHHPDPVTDFLIETEELRTRVHDRRLGICKPGTTPEPWGEIIRDIDNALNSDWLDGAARDARRTLFELLDFVDGAVRERAP